MTVDKKHNLIKSLIGICIVTFCLLTMIKIKSELEIIDSTKKIEIHHIEKQTNIYVDDYDFSEKELYLLILKMKIQNPNVVFAQAQLESGFFKKPIFKLNNNLFGIKKSYTRPTMRERIKPKHKRLNDFSYYSNWRNSVIDYALWQSAYSRNLTESEYLDKLTVVYAVGESDYKDKLISLMKRNKSKLLKYAQ